MKKLCLSIAALSIALVGCGGGGSGGGSSATPSTALADLTGFYLGNCESTGNGESEAKFAALDADGSVFSGTGVFAGSNCDLDNVVDADFDAEGTFSLGQTLTTPNGAEAREIDITGDNAAFEIFQLRGNSLFFGDPATGNGSSAASRPTELADDRSFNKLCSPDANEHDDAPANYNLLGVNSSSRHDHCEDGLDGSLTDVIAGTSYVIRTTNLSAASDTVLTVFDENGTEVASNDDCDDTGNCAGQDGLSSRVEFTASTSGRYTIEVESFNNVPSPETGYTLRVEQQ